MEINIKENLKMETNMEEVFTAPEMEISLKESINMEKGMGKGFNIVEKADMKGSS